ncbi:MAG: tol-pal system-associated acyl-CoA thioesterase [Pseudomonadota bacterium]|jgi:acyl-CoA thioester hydrolase
MSRPEHHFDLRVYWEDTDAGGVVFFVNYLKFFERARTEWLRELGFSQETWRAMGSAFVVSNVQVRYLQPSRLDDLIHITTRVKNSGQAVSDSEPTSNTRLCTSVRKRSAARVC